MKNWIGDNPNLLWENFSELFCGFTGIKILATA